MGNPNLGPMFHGTREDNMGGFVFPGVDHVAYATSSPEEARFYGETKIAKKEHVGKPVKVYQVTPVQSNEVEAVPGTKEGVTHYKSRQGFMITGEHK